MPRDSQKLPDSPHMLDGPSAFEMIFNKDFSHFVFQAGTRLATMIIFQETK